VPCGPAIKAEAGQTAQHGPAWSRFGFDSIGSALPLTPGPGPVAALHACPATARHFWSRNLDLPRRLGHLPEAECAAFNSVQSKPGRGPCQVQRRETPLHRADYPFPWCVAVWGVWPFTVRTVLGAAFKNQEVLSSVGLPTYTRVVF